MQKIKFLFISLIAVACNRESAIPISSLQKKDINPLSNRITTGRSCETEPKTVYHAFGSEWSRTVTLPATGKFVNESHYVTTQDKFPGGRLFANTVTENINTHLNRSLALYKEYDPNATFNSVYGLSYQREWTPAEAGAIGQGSIGNIQVETLTPEKEMWSMNMMWKPGTIPARDTKFIVSANGKKVVVVAGYETGSRSQAFLGGFTTEVHRWLGTNNDSQITIAYLKDQTIPPGPIDCTASNVPVPVSPSNTAVNVNMPVSFSWTSPVNAQAFRLQVSTSHSGWTETNGFTSTSSPSFTVVVNASLANTLNFTWNAGVVGAFEAPKPNRTYYYTIRSFDQTTGTSKYSAVRSFTTLHTVLPLLPANGASVNTPVSLSWDNALANSSYRIQISKTNSGWTAANGFTTESNPTVNVPVNYSAPNLLSYMWQNGSVGSNATPIAGTTYYWTVRYFNTATGTSQYSSVRSFKIN